MRERRDRGTYTVGRWFIPCVVAGALGVDEADVASYISHMLLIINQSQDLAMYGDLLNLETNGYRTMHKIRLTVGEEVRDGKYHMWLGLFRI